jgi:hypothetical protein
LIERPMGAYTPEEQARNLMEVAAAARAAGLDGLLTGDSHGGNPGYAATFSPLPTVARLMSVTGDMPISGWSCSPRSTTRSSWPSRSARWPRSPRVR